MSLSLRLLYRLHHDIPYCSHSPYPRLGASNGCASQFSLVASCGPGPQCLE